MGHSSDPVTFYLNIDSRIRKCLVWGRVLHSWSCFHGRNQAVVEKKKKGIREHVEEPCELGEVWIGSVGRLRASLSAVTP